MSLTPSLLTNDRDPTDATQYVTASVTLPGKALGLLAVHVSHGSAVETPSSIVDSGGLTWTLVNNIANATNVRRTVLYKALQNADNTGTVTINFTGTMTGCGWNIIKIISDSNGATVGVVQSDVKTEAAVTSALITLAAFKRSTNLAYGAIQINQNEQPSVGSGFSAIGVFNGTLPNYGHRHEYKANDNTVDFSWVTSGIYTMVAAEIEEIMPGFFFFF